MAMDDKTTQESGFLNPRVSTLTISAVFMPFFFFFFAPFLGHLVSGIQRSDSALQNPREILVLINFILEVEICYTFPLPCQP